MFSLPPRVRRYYENLDIAGFSLKEIEDELEDIYRVTNRYIERGAWKFLKKVAEYVLYYIDYISYLKFV